jgi:hypothetical protein
MKSRRLILLAVTTLVLLAIAGPAWAMPEPPQASRTTVYQELGILHGANYVIVVDSSESMKTRRPAVVAALQAFLGGLTTADKVALVSFRRAPYPVELVYPLSPLSSTAALLGMLPKAYGGTDIGSGLSEALQVLQQADVGPAAVILITDAGQNDFHVTTPEQWNQLIQGFSQLRDRNIDGVGEIVQGYALAWGAGNNAPPFKIGSSCTATSSFTIMQCVFGATNSGELPPAESATSLAALSLNFADLQFAALLASDAKAVHSGTAVTVSGAPVTLNTTKQTATIEVRVTSHTQYLPLWLGDFTAQASGLSGLRVIQASPSYVKLTPGSSATIRLTVTWQSASRPWYAIASPGIHDNVSLNYRLESPWDELMSRAPVAVDRFSPNSSPVVIQLSSPSSVWWRLEPYLALLILLLVALWLFVRFAGLVTTIWVVRSNGQEVVALRTWRPRTSRRLPGVPGAEVTTAWTPWQILRGYAPVSVVIWPRGREEPGGPSRARHQVPLRGYRRQVDAPVVPETMISWGGWLRPGRPPRG